MGANSLGGGLIGQLAVARGLITPEQLRQSLEVHGRNGNQMRLGDMLVAQGLLSSQQLQALLQEQAAIQAQQRQAGPAGAAGDPAKVQEDLGLVQGNVPVGKVSVARKSPADIAAERARAAKKPPLKGKHASADGGIDLDIPDTDIGEFEIENQGVARTIDKAEATPARPMAAVAPAPAASPWGSDPVAPGAQKTPAAPRANAAPPATYDPLATTGGKTIAELVVAATRAVASDLHLHTGYPLVIRQNGKIVASPGVPLTRAQLEPALNDLLPPHARRDLAQTGQAETSLSIPNVARCRVQITIGADGPSAVLRIVPLAIPPLSALGLPGTIARLVTGQGLVLLTGPSGCGKTWSLAALVDIVNVERREHIVCVEKPIEFLHVSKRCAVSQREVPTHAASVARAVRAALHEDPDVLVIGEIDDAETLNAAMIAAEGGRLVLATITAANATRAIARAIGLFPGDQQALAATTLSDTLRAVVAQRLVPMSDGVRRVAITEVLDIDPATAAKIAASDFGAIIPKTTFDQALSAAVRTGSITRDEARRHADRPEPFS